MGIKLRDILIFFFLWISFFIVGVFFYYNYNFYAQEGIFLMEKAQLAMRGNPPRLENLGLIYPPLPYLFYLPLAISSSPVASLIISTLWGAFCVALCIRYLRWIPGNLPIKLISTILFFLNPVFLYVMFAQPSLTLYMCLLVVFVYSFFRFHETRIPYYIVLSGVALGGMAGIRYDTFFLTMLLIPFAPFLISESTEFNLTRIFALTLMLVLPTLIVLGSWIYLNWIFAGEPFYFYFSPYSYFKQVSKEMSMRPELYEAKGNIILSGWIVLKMAFLTFPAYFFVLPTVRTLTLFASAVAPVLLQVVVVFLGISALSPSWFAVLIPISIIMIYYYVNSPIYSRIYGVILVLLMFISIFFGYFALESSADFTERNFAQAIRGQAVDDVFEEELEVAKYLKQNSDDQTMFLVDDAVGYPIVAFYNRPRQFYLPYQYDYLKRIQEPSMNAEYIVIPKRDKTVAGFDQLTSMYPDAFEQGFDYSVLVFQTPNWRVYKSTVKELKTSYEAK